MISRSRPFLATAVAAGVAAAPSAFAQCVEVCDAIHVFTGEAVGDQFGWVSNDVGDLDGDGVHDLVLTAPTNDAGAGNSGRIYVYSGATGDLLFNATGAGFNWRLGHDAGGAGDYNQDGVPDVIAGAPFSGSGRAIVYSGVDGAVLETFSGPVNNAQFGYRVGGGGDFNGDGMDDVIVGSPNSGSGRAYVHSGGTGEVLAIISGPAPGAFFGGGVAFIGDISTPPDGRDDVLVGAPGATGGGAAFVYSFEDDVVVQKYALAPDGPAFNYGLWFMNSGDVNGDGRPDVYVNDYVANRAYIYDGPTGAPIYTLTGDGSGGFGIGRIVDDLNGDGHADLLLAAWNSSAGAPNGGKAFIYNGADGAVLQTLTHDVAGAQFGFDANGMGDVDGDGASDHLITAAWDDNQRGAAYLIAGEIAPPSPDLNGDGVVNAADLAVLLAAFGVCPPDNCPADFDLDGDVDAADLAVLLAAWTG